MMNINTIIEQAKAYHKNLPEPTPLPIPKADQIAGWIDHTLLKAQATEEQISVLCQEACQYKFASVCINPVFIPQAVRELDGSGVPICTVIGFPLGATLTTAKVAEAHAAIDAGAVELDMVLPVGLLKSGKYEAVYQDITALAETCHAHDAHLKVIFENCYLDRYEKIMACLLSKEANADFVKTSTGFGPGGATLEDVALMRAVVGSPEEMGVKAAGGIRTWEDAQAMIAAGANRIGASSGVQIVSEALKAG
jgi:deoxyribose-phosphate aldolase